MEKSNIIRQAAEALLQGDCTEADRIIKTKYPFVPRARETRNATYLQRMNLFIRDGFTDRYDGKKLLNPGMLRVLSHYCPASFPYHPNWQMDKGHIAYWQLYPTIDHVVPIAHGGTDGMDNWVTTSMQNNNIKANWTMDEIGWTLMLPRSSDSWDGLTHDFILLAEKDSALLEYSAIALWYKASKRALKM